MRPFLLIAVLLFCAGGCQRIAPSQERDVYESIPASSPETGVAGSSFHTDESLSDVERTLTALSRGTLSDSALVASLPKNEKDYGVQYSYFTRAIGPLSRAYYSRIDTLRQRACRGDVVLALAYLRYGLLVDGEEAEMYFEPDLRVPTIQTLSGCARAEVFCQAYHQLEREEGERKLERISGVCAITNR